MHSLSLHSIRLDIRKMIFLTLLMTTILIITSSSPSKNLYASPSGIDFYSPNSPPAGVKSLEPLISKWWNWRVSIPSNTSTNWPECLKGDGGVIGNNQSVVFLGDPASAVEKNVNARNQKCEISSSQLLYLTVYPGECSTGSKPNEGEYPNMKSRLTARMFHLKSSVKLLLNHSILLYLQIMLSSGKHLLLVETIHQWLNIIICSSNHCQLEIIR